MKRTDNTLLVSDIMQAVLLTAALVLGALQNFLGAGMFCALGFLGLVSRRGRIPMSPLIGAMAVIAVVAAVFAVIPTTTSLPTRLEEAFRYASYALLALYLSQIKARPLFYALLGLVGVIVATLPLYLAVGAFAVRGEFGGMRFSSIFIHANHLAYTCSFMGSIFLAIAANSARGTSDKALAIIGFASVLIALIVSRSSGGLVAFSLGCIIVLLRGRSLLQSAAIFACVAAVGVAATLFTDVVDLLIRKVELVNPAEISRRALQHHFGGGYGSLAWRLTYWKAMIDAHFDGGALRVLIGSGGGAATEGNYVYFFMRKDPHNDFIKLFIEYGLIGSAVMVISLFRTCNQIRGAAPLGVILFVAMFSGNTIGSAAVIGTFLTAMSYLLATRKGRNGPINQAPK